MELKSENLLIAEIENRTEKVFVEEAIKYLKNIDETGVKQSEIVKDLSFVVSDRTARKYLHKYSGEFWISKKVTKENNATYYSLDTKEKSIDYDEVPKLPNNPNPVL